MSNLLPILKNRQEFAKHQERGMFIDEFFVHDNSPFLMYGEDHGTHMSYSASQNQEADAKIKAEAIKNLEKIEIPIELQDMNGLTIATVSHEYAAEKILDKAFMKKVGEKLESNAIMVGIPMKGFMVAVAKGKDEGKVKGATGMQYDNAETYPISKALYYFLDGEIEMASVEDGSKNMLKNENELLDIVGQNDANGKMGFVIHLGDKNEENMGNKVQTAFQNIIMMALKDSANFNGKIDYHISPDYNEFTPTLEAQLKKFAKNISERGAVQLIGGLSKEGFKVRFFYGKDQLVAETIETEPVQLRKNMEANQSASKATSPQPANVATNVNKTPAKKPWWKFW